ncbi:PREDICTED: receptor-like protein 12 [Camelina sativa]|uniref:Receptor-like protein 12 n=1 Tax=Camelina sativa TaxID=90675 RepID=A0ABM0VYU0_CAMSA|nr:PREDICTED: receptor-like protein 12 [Camelina sativa]
MSEFPNQEVVSDGYMIISYGPSNSKIKSWVNKSDCCSWDGITCAAKSGKVIGLDLSSSFLYGPLKSKSSLFRLRDLRHLNLANNNFNSSQIPADFDKLMELERLNLSSSALSGKIPINLLQLTKLVNSHLQLTILNQLTTFTVAHNKLSGNLPASILNFTQLRRLSLSSNQFTGFLPPIITQFSKLESFRASGNPFTGAVLSSLVQIPSLTHIYLSYNVFNDFTGIENISLLPNLEDFSLGSKHYNKVVGPGVDLNVFSPLKQLTLLHLSGIPLTIANITNDSDFPSNLGTLTLRGCNITEFPEFIRYERNLQQLDLSNNKIKGQVPAWLWRLPKLYSVNLSNNSLSGFNRSLKVSPSRISFVDLSSNAFQGPLFIPPWKHLDYFSGSKNNFTGKIPLSICGLSSLEVLDLSNNNLNGSIPWCLETLVMSSLSDLNLRNNILSGILPEIFHNAKNLISLDVSHNRLEGNVPASLGGCSALEVLNVGSNTFNDMFPFHLNSLQKLQVLVIRSNKFHGTLHNADGVWFGFPQLKIIDVSHNDFFGTLPSHYFLNWTAMSSKSDDNIGPEYIQSPSGYYYLSLVLMSKGVSMEMERILTIYTAIDFSGNQLHGPIPDSIGLLKELRILNMSSNAFTGHIPYTMANLTNLESLDLSQNKISGEIPPELGTLSSLEVINVSHNQLVGSIPQGTQFQRQKCSSYEGNPGLNRPSLKDVCGDIKVLAPPQPELVETKEEEEESFSWVAAGLGFAPGLVFGLVMGYIVASYKHEWFMKFFFRSKQRRTTRNH